MLMRSPDGEVLDIPEAGAAALAALGWEAVGEAPAARHAKTSRRRTTKKQQED